MWYLGGNSALSIFAVALHLYWFFHLYLCWDMCVTSLQCEMIISLSLPLILLLLLPLRFRILSLLEQMNYSNFSPSESSTFWGALSRRIAMGHRCESWGCRGVCDFSLSVLLSQENNPCVYSQNSIFLLSLEVQLTKNICFLFNSRWRDRERNKKKVGAKTPIFVNLYKENCFRKRFSLGKKQVDVYSAALCCLPFKKMMSLWLYLSSWPVFYTGKWIKSHN